MDLILWRHAEAFDAADGAAAADLQRRLTPKGEKQAQRVAAWLNRLLPDDARLLVSPAERCQQTALALGRRFQVREALAPGGTVADLLGLARWPRRSEAVLVVGHQPTLGMTAAVLLGAADAARAAAPPAWSVRKGAVWWLRHRERNGAGEVVLMAVCSPEML